MMKKLSLQELQSVATGAVRIVQEQEDVHFYRFTEEQQWLYWERDPEVGWIRTFATSGVKLRFRTNSEYLRIQTVVSAGSSRTLFLFDIFVDGNLVDTLGNDTEHTTAYDFPEVAYPLGTFEKQVFLGEGDKEVCVHFPWSVHAAIREMAVDDGAYVEPVKWKHKLLCYGDSISHGYDTLHPSRSFVQQLARWLDAEELNKAIGGEVFFPGLLDTEENFDPDYILVAYGTNNWTFTSREVFETDCWSFYRKVRDKYPEATIIALTPIWRKDMQDEMEFGDFSGVEEGIREAVKDLENIVLVSGFDLVPQDEKLFSDGLHPTDEGFAYYFENFRRNVSSLEW